MRSLVPVTKQNAGLKPYNCGRQWWGKIYHLDVEQGVRHLGRLGTWNFSALQATSPDLITYNTAIAACFGAPPHVASDAWFFNIYYIFRCSPTESWPVVKSYTCQEFAKQMQKYRRIHWLTDLFLHLLAQAFLCISVLKLLRPVRGSRGGGLWRQRDAKPLSWHCSLSWGCSYGTAQLDETSPDVPFPTTWPNWLACRTQAVASIGSYGYMIGQDIQARSRTCSRLLPGRSHVDLSCKL